MAVKNIYGEEEKKKNRYSSNTVAYSSNAALPHTQSTPQNNVWNAEQSTPQVQSYTPQKRKREKSPSELGEEALGLMLSEDALEARQPAVNKRAAAQPPANTGPEESATRPLANTRPGEYTFQSMQRSDLFTSPQQIFGGMTGSAYTELAGQPQTAVQNPTTAATDRGSQSTPDRQLPVTAATQNLKSTAPNGSASGDPAYKSRLSSKWQQAWKPADPIQPTIDSAMPVFGSVQPAREELLLAAAPDLAAAGIDMNAVRAGLWIGDQINQIAEDSYLASGTSPWAYVGENFLSGGWGALENGWNGFIDYTLPLANSALDQQMRENEQLALMFGGDFGQYFDSQNALLQEARDGMPEAVETLRRHEAAAYQQSILDRYDPHGAYIPIGEISSGVGQGVTQMGLGAINPAVATAQQFFSASGSMAQEARENGASDELALLSGAFSGGKEILNNKFFGGIPFLGDSFADDLAMRLAGTDKGRAILKAIFNIGGEGLEEGIGTYEDALISKLWNGDDRGVWQTIKETTPDAVHAGLISMGTSSLLTPFSFVPEYRDARIVDEALDIMNNGGMLTDTKLSDATAAMHRLMGDGHNSWNGVPFNEWTDTLNKHLDGQLSPAANSGRNAADLTGIDASNLIMFPMLKDTNAQTNATADSNAIPFLAAGNTAAAQNGPQASSNIIFFPIGNELGAQTRTDANSNAVSLPAANSAAVTQNGQTNTTEAAHQTSPLPNAPDMSTERTSGDTTQQTSLTAEPASAEAIAEQNARVRQQALEKGKAKGIELNTAEKLMEITGLKLQYIYEENSGVDGFINGDTVTVNLASDTSAFCVAAHEAGHSMKVTDAKKFEAFQTSVQRIIESNAELKQYAEKIRADYTAENSPALASLMNADGTINTAALEEDVCLKTFERLIEDPERLVQAVAHDRSAIESFLDVLRGIKNSLVIKFTGSEKAMLDEAERTMVNLLRGEAGMVDGERFSYIGENANLNKTERAALNMAKQMELEGETAMDIRWQTGWFRSMDGKWRMEVDDSVAEYFPNGDAHGAAPGQGTKVRDFIRHPQLERLEPDIFNLPMQVDPTMKPGTNGQYEGRARGISVKDSTTVNTVLHEIQHGIQEIEGFAQGSNSDQGKKWAMIVAHEQVKDTPEYQQLQNSDARFQYVQNKAMEITGRQTLDKAGFVYYANAAGEVEAQDTANRANLTAFERAGQKPDLSGNARYGESPFLDYIDMLRDMGYANSEMLKRMRL
ncbi:MAG: hypothetical protein HDT26_12760 [Subdoligranulum sp.]|nr:hypothetical protein [Subdoligranulum sp.]